MWSVRPFNPRCAAVLGERAAEAMAARLDAAADRCATALRVGDWPSRPLWTGSRYEGCPNEEKRGPAPPKFGTPPETRAPPKPTPPPRLPTPPPCPPPKPPPACPPPPPPPWGAAQPACARDIDMMPTRLSNLNDFM